MMSELSEHFFQVSTQVWRIFDESIFCDMEEGEEASAFIVEEVEESECISRKWDMCPQTLIL